MGVARLDAQMQTGVLGQNAWKNCSGAYSLHTQFVPIEGISKNFHPSMGAPGSGVYGWSDQGIGVRWASDLERSGVFGPETPKLNMGSAQIQLMPETVSTANISLTKIPPQDLMPSLPRNGQAGDLIAVTTQGSDITLPWFCVRSHPDLEAATRAEVPLGRIILGNR